MITYTVHEQGEPAVDRIDRAEELVFVKDGFNFAAAAFAPFWLLANTLWFEFIGYVAVVVMIAVGADWAGLSEMWTTIAFVAVHLFVGAEADTLRRGALGRRGWSTVGTVVGRNAGECERRFFDGWLDRQPLLRRADVAADGAFAAGAGARPGVESVIGSVGARPVAGGSGHGAGARRWWPFGN